jgi:hypothetical protein
MQRNLDDLQDLSRVIPSRWKSIMTYVKVDQQASRSPDNNTRTVGVVSAERGVRLRVGYLKANGQSGVILTWDLSGESACYPEAAWHGTCQVIQHATRSRSMAKL